MRWLLVFLFPIQLLAQVQVLPPGVYKDLRPTKPIVLKKGTYTFIGLEMTGKVLAPGQIRGPDLVWLDAMKATEVHFENCTFTQISRGTVLRLAGKVTINNCRFVGTDWEAETLERGKPNQNMGKTGIEYHQGGGITLTNSTLQNLNYGMVFYGSTASGTRTNSVTENLFANNEQNLRFKSTYKSNFKLTLKCNTFTTPTNPAPFTNRYGMWVESGAEMPDIGGNLSPENPTRPSANWWPVAGTNNSSISPWPISLNNEGTIEYWYSPTGWETVHNLTDDEWRYFQYKNEYIGPFTNPNGEPYFLPNVVNRIVRSRSDQINATPFEMDDACSNFGQILVFPTRPVVSQDSTLTENLKALQSEDQFLGQNFPNPSTGTTIIIYKLPEKAKKGRIEFFELGTGRIIKSVGIPMGGQGKIEFGLQEFSTGLYGYRLMAEDKPVAWKKIIVSR